MITLYSKIFLAGDISRDALQLLVAKLSGGRVVDSETVYAEGLEIDVLDNPDARISRKHGLPDDFLYFPHVLDVVMSETPVLEVYLSLVGRLMTALNAEGMTVVAACDWEERLPGHGRLEGRRADE